MNQNVSIEDDGPKDWCKYCGDPIAQYDCFGDPVCDCDQSWEPECTTVNQTYIDGTAPQIAAGPWTAELDGLESGAYLVETHDGDLGIYLYSGTDKFPDEDPLWIDAIRDEPADSPRMAARIYRRKKGES